MKEIKQKLNRLKEMDEERVKLYKEIESLLNGEAEKYKGKVFKLNKHKGFNWAYFDSFKFGGHYEVIAVLKRGGNSAWVNFKNLEEADEEFIKTKIGDKLPK